MRRAAAAVSATIRCSTTLRSASVRRSWKHRSRTASAIAARHWQRCATCSTPVLLRQGLSRYLPMDRPSSALPALSLYIHIPWCVRKCPYCDFNSHNARQAVPQAEYVDALLRDLDQDLPLAQGRPLASIFFGGGTPSLFTPDSIARILDGVAARLDVPRATEVTLETNPGTVEHGPFGGYARAGVNRISFGVQSFD